MMSRQIVRRVKAQWSAYDFGGSIGKLIERLEELRAVHGDDLKVDGDLREEYGNACFDLTFYKNEPETDEEVTKREQQEAAFTSFRRAQYEKLKKEFGDD